jgi:Na+-translocating ferredoxin:NAD+ oxidoreductase subunit B
VKRKDLLYGLLPQTQCRRCGFADCAGYAESMDRGFSSPNLCAPGGEDTRKALFSALDLQIEPIGPIHEDEEILSAVIDEEDCIGCTKCIQQCPTDAIIGSQSAIHTVVEQWCTGCSLCISVCPTDCITLFPISNPLLRMSTNQSNLRYIKKKERLDSNGRFDNQREYIDIEDHEPESLRNIVAAALERKRQALDSQKD